MRDYIVITVGVLMFGAIRDYLNHCKFIGMDIQVLESGGFISKDFTVRGKSSDLTAIKRHLEQQLGLN